MRKYDDEQVLKFLNLKFPNNEKLLSCLLDLYVRYSSWGIKDKKFEKEFFEGSDGPFYSYLWEMILAAYFVEAGWEVSSSDVGPDFLIGDDSQPIWVEAICPGPTGLPKEWLEASDEIRAISVPHEQILLRWTSALKEKKDKLMGSVKRNNKTGDEINIPGYLEKGYVDARNPYVIAINSCRLGLYESDLLYVGVSQLPYAVEAAFPIGPLAVEINRETLETSGAKHTNRWFIEKDNGSNVPTDSFLNPDYQQVSAIIGSCAGLNAVCGRKPPIAIVHNPIAENPLPVGLIEVDEEFIAEDKGDHYELRRAGVD